MKIQFNTKISLSFYPLVDVRLAGNNRFRKKGSVRRKCDESRTTSFDGTKQINFTKRPIQSRELKPVAMEKCGNLS